MKVKTKILSGRQDQENNRTKNYFLAFGLGKIRENLVENISMLIGSGMSVNAALDAVAGEMHTPRLEKIIQQIKTDINSGTPLWKAFDNSGIFPAQAIPIIRIGEQSGKLPESLKVVASQHEKQRMFRSKVSSAMMYPLFVLALALLIGIGISWFILPKLATVFSQLKIKLPMVTQILIDTGIFLDKYGKIAVPSFLLLLSIFFYFIFIYRKTNFIGQYLLFLIPGVKGLLKEIELARFGYLLGTLLEAGLIPTQALDSLANVTNFRKYRHAYQTLCSSIDDGNSFQQSFSQVKGINKLIPLPVQQMIVAGEQSGNLSEILLKIGTNYENKSDTTTKNLTVILEPVLLVVVWLGVMAIAFAVILPIYNLIGNFNT